MQSIVYQCCIIINPSVLPIRIINALKKYLRDEILISFSDSYLAICCNVPLFEVYINTLSLHRVDCLNLWQLQYVQYTWVYWTETDISLAWKLRLNLKLKHNLIFLIYWSRSCLALNQCVNDVQSFILLQLIWDRYNI